ncbi:MAG: NAD(+)/NADH kinase [Bdellovibrionales bacterium]|nr:NAD(+)/NADH kinase [Bdellovibrionales bacterium]
MTTIKKVVVIYRKDTDLAKKKAIEVAQLLTDKNINVFSHPKQTIPLTSKKNFPKVKSFKNIDLVIVLGGDGTYLEAVRILDSQEVPILGINMGSLGFLTNTPVEAMHLAIEKVLALKMEMRPRTMLNVKVLSKNKVIARHRALNDIVIERGANSHLTNFSLFIDNQLISPIKADGVIISTPTGSTAYNLAAGGPILHPETQSYVVTPICPHSLTHRPTLLPDHLKLRFELNDKTKSAFLTVDGVRCGEIHGNDQIIVEKCDCYHYVLRDPSHNYFNLLREKLKFGERA